MTKRRAGFATDQSISLPNEDEMRTIKLGELAALYMYQNF